MRLLTSVISLLSLCAGTWALHESDVGVVDWHKHLVGVPLAGLATTAPSFHRSGNKSLILTATANNVLAALEPEDGSVLWRYLFDPEDRIIGYFKGDNVVATLSAPGGGTLRTFDTVTGNLLLEKRIHAPEAGALLEPAHFGKDVAFTPNLTDIYVLTNGFTITKLNGTTGEVKWSWMSDDRGTKVISSKLILTTDALYAIGVGQSVSSYTLHIRTLSPITGELIKDSSIVSSVIDPLAQLITLSSSDPEKPLVLWLDKGTLRHLSLTPTLDQKPRLMKGIGFAQLANVGLSNFGHAVITRNDGSSFIIKIDEETGYPKPIWEYQDSVKSEDNADSMFAGGVDTLGRPYVARVFWSHRAAKGSADVFAGHLAEGQGLASGYMFPFDTRNHGVISHVALDAENPTGWNVNSRLLATTSTGSVQLWEKSKLKWAREESLATTAIAQLVEIPEKAVSEQDPGAVEGFITRVTRQIADAQGFPQYLFHFAKRFVTGSYASATDSALPTSSSSSEGLSRDAFGFRQVIVAATIYGKIFGLDSSNGEIIWSRVLGLGWADEIGGMIQPVKLFVLKTVSDGGDPEVVLVGQRKASNSLVDTVVFHMNALTGADVTGNSLDDATLESQDIIQGPLVEGYLLNTETKVVVLLDEFLQVYIYPDTSETRDAFTAASDHLSFPLLGNVETRQRIIGHKIPPPSNLGHRPVAYGTWSLTLPEGEAVQALLPQATHGPIASVGKVLGNRTTLYKYLDPRLFVALTAAPIRGVCGVYVMDATKGTVVYHAEVKASPGRKGSGSGCDVKATLVENWLVYHYYESELAGGTVADTVGYRMVSVEFYEGQEVDQKIESSDLSPYSNDTLNFRTFEEAFIFPYAITAVMPTSTKFGITSKDLIVATVNHRIQSFPRRALDPRRPHRKITSEEAEEQLFTYDPLLPNDPRRVLSHNYEVCAHRIITSPSLLESTSIVFAYGLDMFLTRVAPSGTFDVLSENFNKAQLVITIAGLLIAILVTRPMVQRKKLREKWYQS